VAAVTVVVAAATAVAEEDIANPSDESSRRLNAADWKRIQDTMPICCVDVLPVTHGSTSSHIVQRVGLILRDTPHQGRRWCLVGGRLFRDESISQAISRQIGETLGPAARFSLPPDPQPAHVAQYFTTPRAANPVDPRQHAIGLTFVVDMEGDITPAGEAHHFEWFQLEMLPKPAEFGFGQDRVLAACLERLGIVWPAVQPLPSLMP
jgi:ADP-ribose pyrophosphatase YjhB (NUDIX family)